MQHEVMAEEPSSPPTAPSWQQGALVELLISDLNHEGAGVGRYDGRVVFVPDTVVGDRLLARLLHVKPSYAHGKLHQLLDPSPHRIRPHCIVADKCGGCQWQHIDYAFQLEAKRNLVMQTLERIGGFQAPPVNEVLAVSDPLGYRNKATYPVRGIEHREEGQGIRSKNAGDRKAAARMVREGVAFPALKSRRGNRLVESVKSDQSARANSTYQVQAGYYQKGSHHLINLNQCPIQDNRLNPLLAEVKQDIQQLGWPIYEESSHRGEIRHLGFRIGRRTGEILLTLVATKGNLPDLEAQAQTWLERYPDLVGVSLNLNPGRTNAILGDETRCIAGQPFLIEEFAGLQFQIHPTTFFQVNTEQAEALLQTILDELQLQGHEVVLDAYAGIGTMTLPVANQVREAIALELQPEAVEQAKRNAALNQIANVTFQQGAVEEQLPELTIQPDVVLLDPPRKGCEAVVLETLLKLQPARIVYVSCNPSTLARDLKHLCGGGQYQLTRVQPADFFPQTAHVECAAFLSRMV